MCLLTTLELMKFQSQFQFQFQVKFQHKHKCHIFCHSPNSKF